MISGVGAGRSCVYGAVIERKWPVLPVSAMIIVAIGEGPKVGGKVVGIVASTLDLFFTKVALC
jgi:hypothetical protein